jgi:translation initiation factor IF-2
MATETKTATRTSQGNRSAGRGSDGRREGPRTNQPAPSAPPAAPKVLELPASISLRDLAARMNVSPINVIRELMQNGVMATINQQLDFDTAAIVASAFGWDAQPIPLVTESQAPEPPAATTENKTAPASKVVTLKQRLLAKEQAENEGALKPRPPVVTVMGHVDHGKTSLLDAIRKTNVASTEAGGITQHIGAYMVEHQGRKITFLDTPGHEAFTAMRARGAQVTDIAVLVVAADDGVMPQTREAIAHARAAQVPIIVALNKIDKPNARPEIVKKELSELGLVPDEWGGNTLFIPVSAKQRIGIEDLLEGILLVAESLDTIKANPNRAAVGTIIESQLSKSKGPIATVLVQNGTLNIGDAFVAGSTYGRVRAMFDFRGQSVKKAGPSMPVSITGLAEVPNAGDILEVVEDERTARALAMQNQAKLVKEREVRRITNLEQLFALAQANKAQKMLFIVKADTQGSLQPIVEQLYKLNPTEGAQNAEAVRLEVIYQGIGDVTESDVNLAIASGAIILGYEVGVDTAARRKAESNQVDIRLYDVIYNLIEDVEKAMKGSLAPKIVEKVIGTAEVKQTFKIAKVGIVAGVRVTSGIAARNAKVRVQRGSQLLHTGVVASLKRLTEDVKEVRQGFECGLSIEGFQDFKPGDLLEFFVEEQVS